MRIYYIVDFVNLLHVSVTFVATFRDVFYEGCITKITKPMYQYKY